MWCHWYLDGWCSESIVLVTLLQFYSHRSVRSNSIFLIESKRQLLSHLQYKQKLTKMKSSIINLSLFITKCKVDLSICTLITQEHLIRFSFIFICRYLILLGFSLYLNKIRWIVSSFQNNTTIIITIIVCKESN